MQAADVPLGACRGGVRLFMAWREKSCQVGAAPHPLSSLCCPCRVRAGAVLSAGWLRANGCRRCSLGGGAGGAGHAGAGALC